MRVVGFITQPAVITRILDHLRKREREFLARLPTPRSLWSALPEIRRLPDVTR
jgi:hypothetical protein